MDVLDAIFQRHSARSYLEKAPSRTTLETLMAAAQQAPSAFNRQASRFTVITDRTLLDEISACSKIFMTQNRPLDLPEPLYGKLADPDFHVFYHAPTLIVMSADAQGPWLETDCALAGQNLMLAAVSAGLGTCWIGLCQPFLETAEGRDLIDMPIAERVFAPIIVGYPKEPPVVSPREAARVKWM
jgi:nitroreductase